MTIEIKPWVKRGGMLFNTSCLDIEDPEHIYTQIVALGKRPEDYGYKHPFAEEFENYSRDQLITEVISLRKSLEALERYL